jgi:hypothetical protein
MDGHARLDCDGISQVSVRESPRRHIDVAAFQLNSEHSLALPFDDFDDFSEQVDSIL